MRADAVLRGEPLEDRQVSVAVDGRVGTGAVAASIDGLSSRKRCAKPVMSGGFPTPPPWICASMAWKPCEGSGEKRSGGAPCWMGSHAVDPSRRS